MKKNLWLVLFTAITFTVLTYSTASFHRQVDGSDNYGFPVSFYEIYSEMAYPARFDDMAHFIFLNLVLDIAIAFLITIIIFGIYNKVKTMFIRKSK